MVAGDIKKHDIIINGRGFMREAKTKPPVTDQDGQPGIARNAGGEGRYDYFTNDAFEAWVSGSGGMGQQRKVAADKYLTGIGRSEFPGQFYPAMQVKYESAGGSESWYFRLGDDLYGFGPETVTKVGSSDTWARPAGDVIQQPIVSGNGNAFWVQHDGDSDDLLLVRWLGEGHEAEDITSSNYAPLYVTRFGRHLFQFAERDLPTAPRVIQVAAGSNDSSTIHSVSWTQPTKPGSQLFLIAMVQNSHVAVPDSAAWGDTITTGEVSRPGMSMSLHVWTLPNAQQRDGTESVTFSASNYGVLFVVEVEGLASHGRHEALVRKSGGDGTLDAGSLSSPTSGSFRLSILARGNNSSNGNTETITHSGAWDELIQQDIEASGSSNNWMRASLAWSTTATSDGFTPVETAPLWATILLSVAPTNRTLPIRQLVILATTDDGQNWEPAPANISTGEIGQIRATLASDEKLYFTTDRGLYNLTYGENEFGTDEKINIGIRGPGAEWQLPADDNLGSYLAGFDNAIYYPVGGSIHRFVGGVVGPAERLLWPRAEWTTTSGTIQALVSGEGGLYFGAGGYLWNYNGDGFFAHAAEPAAGALDTLHWHKGKLYMRGNPAPYLDYGYPSMRPDQVTLDPGNYTDGVYISSMLDFEKVDMRKFLRRFQTHCRFSEPDPAKDSGKLVLQVLKGCTTAPDPGQLGGGADALEWVTIGEHTNADGYVETFVLDDADLIVCYRLYLRLLLEVGADGFPIPEGVAVYGRTEMPDTRLFSPVLELSTSVVEKGTGRRLYPTEAEVAENLAFLAGLRTDVPFTVTFDDGTAEGQSYLCTMISFTRHKVEDAQDSGATNYLVQLQLLEVP